MDRAAVEQLLDEIISSLEDLETKAGATLQFLKDKGHATDEDLAPYLEQAGNASNVRWRAARLRMMSLLGSALKAMDPASGGRKAAADNAKNLEEEKKTEAEKAAPAEQNVQPKNEEPQPTPQTKEPAVKKVSAESTKPSDPRSPQGQASAPEEQQPLAEAKGVEPKRPTPEEASKTPTQDSRDALPKSKEDAA